MQLSRIVFGCEALGGTDWGDVNLNDINSAINKALDLGINFYDTAEIYGLGLSEERLSQTLGSKRHDVFIATKGGLSWTADSSGGRAIVHIDCSPRTIVNSVENSLRRLRIDCIPLYYIHWPDILVDFKLTFNTLEKLVHEGKIGSIGCSNFSINQLHAALQVAPVKYLQIPINLFLGPPSQELIEICLKYKVNIVAYNVLSSGILSGKYDLHHTFPDNDRRSRLPLFKGALFKKSLDQIEEFRVEANSLGITLSEYSIRWVLKQKLVDFCIVGLKSVAQVESAYSASLN